MAAVKSKSPSNDGGASPTEHQDTVADISNGPFFLHRHLNLPGAPPGTSSNIAIVSPTVKLPPPVTNNFLPFEAARTNGTHVGDVTTTTELMHTDTLAHHSSTIHATPQKQLYDQYENTQNVFSSLYDSKKQSMLPAALGETFRLDNTVTQQVVSQVYSTDANKPLTAIDFGSFGSQGLGEERFNAISPNPALFDKPPAGHAYRKDGKVPVRPTDTDRRISDGDRQHPLGSNKTLSHARLNANIIVLHDDLEKETNLATVSNAGRSSTIHPMSGSSVYAGAGSSGSPQLDGKITAWKENRPQVNYIHYVQEIC